MYGSSLYGRELYCPFNYERGYYGEPGAHIVSGGAASLVVPGGEAPSSVFGTAMSGPQADSPRTLSLCEIADSDPGLVNIFSVTTPDIQVPGVEAPSTTEGVLLSAFGAVALLMPAPPKYMFSESFTTGTANPYLYDTGLYDDRVLEDPYTSFTVSEYNTGMAMVDCVVGRGALLVQGGFEFNADMLITAPMSAHEHIGAVVTNENHVMDVMIMDRWDGANPPYVWQAMIAESLNNSQARPVVPQMHNSASSVPGVITPVLDTQQLIPMSFGGVLIDVPYSPDYGVIAPASMATAYNGIAYTEDVADRPIYGHRYTYVSRGAQYLGLTNWRAQYVDGQTVAGVLPSLLDASLDCGYSTIIDIYFDYMFALERPVAVSSHPMPALPYKENKLLRSTLYAQEHYLGRSAMYNAILALTGDLANTPIFLRDADFKNYHDSLYFDSSVIVLSDSMSEILAPLATQEAEVFAPYLLFAPLRCGTDTTEPTYIDIMGTWETWDNRASAMPAPDVSAPVYVFDMLHDMDSYMVFTTECARAYAATQERTSCTFTLTADAVELSVVELTADDAMTIPSYALTELPVTQSMLTSMLDSDYAHTFAFTEATFYCSHSSALRGTMMLITEVCYTTGSSREENASALAAMLLADGGCDMSSPTFPGSEGLIVFVSENIMYSVDAHSDALVLQPSLLFTDIKECDFSYVYAAAESCLYLAATYRAPDVLYDPNAVASTHVAVADFFCDSDVVRYPEADIASTLEATYDSAVYSVEEVVCCVGFSLAATTCSMAHYGSFEGVITDVEYNVIAILDNSHVAMAQFATQDCTYSVCYLPADAMVECIYINIQPQPYWYDFVIDYDFSSTSDPTDMAFIF